MIKVKVIPWQAEVAQGVPGRFKTPDFLDVRHYKGGRSSAKTHRPPLPQEKSLVLTFRGWFDLRAHGSVGGTTEKKSPVTPPGIDPGTVRLVAKCLNHYATPGPHIYDNI